MSAVEKLDRLAERTISQFRATMKAAWSDACQHEGIPSDALFVVFSDDNPFVPFLNTATQQYHEAVEQRRVFGYVGLNLSHPTKL